jgi:hypothetical protein
MGVAAFSGCQVHKANTLYGLIATDAADSLTATGAPFDIKK